VVSRSPTIPAPVVAVLAAIVVVAWPSAAAHAAPCWWPPVVAPVADPYREPACRWCPGNRGIEYATEPATAVRAVAAGRVSFAGEVVGRRYVVVVHATGWRTTYGDLASVRVARGDAVVARSIVGTTSRSLHFGLRDRDGYRDPAPFIGRLVHVPRLIPVDGSAGPPPGRSHLRCSSIVARRAG